MQELNCNQNSGLFRYRTQVITSVNVSPLLGVRQLGPVTLPQSPDVVLQALIAEQEYRPCAIMDGASRGQGKPCLTGDPEGAVPPPKREENA